MGEWISCTVGTMVLPGSAAGQWGCHTDGSRAPMPRFASPVRCVFHVRGGDLVPKQRLEEGRAPVRVHGLAVKERQAGDPAEQREVRQVVCARGGGAVRVGLQRAASVLAQEQPAVRKQHLVECLLSICSNELRRILCLLVYSIGACRHQLGVAHEQLDVLDAQPLGPQHGHVRRRHQVVYSTGGH